MCIVCASLGCIVDEAEVIPAVLQEQVQCHHLLQHPRHVFAQVLEPFVLCTSSWFFIHGQIARGFGVEQVQGDERSDIIYTANENVTVPGAVLVTAV